RRGDRRRRWLYCGLVNVTQASCPGVMDRRVARREGFLARLRHAVGCRDEAIGEGCQEVVTLVAKRDTVLRSPRTGHGWDHLTQVQAQRLGEGRLRRGIGPEQALLLGVCLDAVDHVLRPPGHAQVAKRLVVDREERGGGPELWAHVADRGPVGDREAG